MCSRYALSPLSETRSLNAGILPLLRQYRLRTLALGIAGVPMLPNLQTSSELMRDICIIFPPSEMMDRAPASQTTSGCALSRGGVGRGSARDWVRAGDRAEPHGIAKGLHQLCDCERPREVDTSEHPSRSVGDGLEDRDAGEKLLSGGKEYWSSGSQLPKKTRQGAACLLLRATSRAFLCLINVYGRKTYCARLSSSPALTMPG
ncbi:hypothetical protein BDK51DRAFT_40652 [Blyttiomyces helicus]|uniref:Uncharacterized protein n=1 Tax=Blyttiomyces helicus TaxID=388810 RepID=A0A4P9WDU3_9FUNG|nr:hypothetical protein BDK51DRAFT_40652 [Blyttiomyces helicus]|eukprot:RKO89915.1 hypothetical protein BDK51DRAFT_40652 [Blyttiomyces helicus]